MQVEVEGATLNVAVTGPEHAPPVLQFNGAMCALPMWEHTVSRLADRYRMIRFDVRGIGQSTASLSDDLYSFKRYAADIVLILDHLEVERAHLWSMAWGSRVAMAFATLEPSRVASAAFFDASIGPADVKAQAAGHKRAVEAQVRAGIPVFERPAGWNQHADSSAARRATAAASRFDLAATIDGLSMPVLVATGDHDPNLESSREIVERVGDARLVVMKDVGHGSVLQRPDRASEIFDGFMK